ncbi:MAG TPA: hypothetical protein VFU59_05545, partial [Candidatus Eisenbacteria bacterium]|nr:hypothetical protein [Candidatus Eisenbacteria bacterium]
GPEGIREILGASDRREGVEKARVALRGLKGYPREWESNADKLTLLYLSRVGFTSEGYARSMEAFLPPATRTLGRYWEAPDDRETPLDKRLSGVRGEYSAMGLDAGLPCEQQPYAPIRARLGEAP